MRRYLFFYMVAMVFVSCQNDQGLAKEDIKEFTFAIKNPAGLDWKSKTIEIPASFLNQKIKEKDWEKLHFSDGENLAFQIVQDKVSQNPEKVLLAMDIPANTEKEVKVQILTDIPNNNFTKRTQAEISHKTGGIWEDRKYKGGTFKNVQLLKVPPEHTDHSEFIRYEGPGWESDKVAYRFYLDWRNAVDIFGKKTSEMVLQKVGLDGFDSYHEPADWGMDVLKVGRSLGIGSIGFWSEGKATRIEKTDSLQCDILQNGNLQSKIRTSYYGWQINNQQLDLISDLSIQAGSRLTRQDIFLSEALPNICTGIVKHENGTLLQSTPTDKSQWGYIATFGKQSLADDRLGMVVFFKMTNLLELQEDENSHVVVLQPDQQHHLTYYFGAVWEQESEGVQSLEAFQQYLDRQAQELNTKMDLSF